MKPQYTLLQIGEVDARSVQKTSAGTAKNVRPVHSLPASLLHNSILFGIAGIRATFDTSKTVFC